METVGRWGEQGYSDDQIWGAVAARYARFIERHYHLPAHATPQLGLSHLYFAVDAMLEEMLPMLNLSKFIVETVGHLDLTLEVTARPWRLFLLVEHFPY
jgi:hypothetical protein